MQLSGRRPDLAAFHVSGVSYRTNRQLAGWDCSSASDSRLQRARSVADMGSTTALLRAQIQPICNAYEISFDARSVIEPLARNPFLAVQVHRVAAASVRSEL